MPEINDACQNEKTREQLIEELRESEARFRLLFDNAPLGYQSLDENGYFIEVNQAWLDTLGYARKEVIGRSFADFLHPDWKEHFKINFPIFKAVGEVLGVEFEMVKKDGSYILVSFNGKIGKDEKGRFRQTHCILHDITDRKQAERQLASQRELLKSIFDTIPILLVIWDPQLQRFTLNRHAESVLGWTTADANDGDFMSKVYPNPDYRAKVTGYMQSLELGWHEWIVTTKCGDPVPIDWANICLSDDTMIGIGVDLRERKHTEIAIQEREQRLRLAAEGAELGVFEWNVKTDVPIWENRRMYEIFGLSQNDPPVDRIQFTQKFIHPEDLPRFEDEIAESMRTGDRFKGVYRIRRQSDNEWRWIAYYGQFQFTPESEAVRLVSVLEDVTDQKRAEEALRESEQRYRSIFTNMGEGFALGEALFDKNGVPCEFCFLEINDAFERLTGLSKEILGHPITKVLPNLEDHWIDSYCGVAVSGKPVRFQNFNRDTGRHYDVFCYSPSRNRFAILFRDITEQVNNENALRQMNERLQEQTERLKRLSEELQAQAEELSYANQELQRTHGLIESITKSTDDLIAAQNSDFQYIYFNDAYRREFEKLWGRKIETGTSMVEALSPWPQEQLKARGLWARALQGESFSITEEFGPAEPEKQIYQLQFNPVYDAQDRQIGAAHILRNVTEQVRLQQKLVVINETLEQQVAERTKLAEARSKQLQSLAVELIETEERERRKFAHLLHDDLQQMLAAANMQLQALSDIMPNELALVDVGLILKESIEKSRRLSHELSPPVLYHSGLTGALQWLSLRMGEQFDLKVELKVSTDPLLSNIALKTFLFRSAQELLFNIVKHSGVNRARIVVSRSESAASISVIDEGDGFDPVILKEAKTGFGLLTIKERASYIGGSLNIESAPGKGSRITLTVPLHATSDDKIVRQIASVRPQSNVIEAPAQQMTRVLFADDHHIMRQGLVNLVNGQPQIEVVGEAANGQEALEKALHLRPDVVVMDISMPVMDGIEATRRIKAELPGVRVIGLSMHIDEQSAISMRNAGAECYMVKTASPKELIHAIYGPTPDNGLENLKP